MASKGLGCRNSQGAPKSLVVGPALALDELAAQGVDLHDRTASCGQPEAEEARGHRVEWQPRRCRHWFARSSKRNSSLSVDSTRRVRPPSTLR
jgi:hypothetical protein